MILLELDPIAAASLWAVLAAAFVWIVITHMSHDHRSH